MRRLFVFILILLFCVDSFSQSEKIVRKGDKYIYTGDGKLFHKRYDSIRDFKEGRAAVMRKGAWNFIDESGKRINNQDYLAVHDYNGGLAGVKTERDNYWELVTLKGEKTGWHFDSIVYVDSFAIGITYQYYGSSRVQYTLYHALWKNGSSITVDSLFKRNGFYVMVYPDAFSEKKYRIMDSHLDFRTDYFVSDKRVLDTTLFVRSTSGFKYAVLNTDATISNWYNDIGPDTNGFRVVKTYSGKGVINRDLKEIIGTTYETIDYTGANFIVRAYSKSTLIDTTGKHLTPSYAEINYLGDDRYSAKVTEYARWYSILDSHGDSIAGEFAMIFRYNSGLARVISGDGQQFGYIDTNGVMLTGWYDRGADYHEPSTDDGGNIGIGIFRFILGVATAALSEIFIDWDNVSGTSYNSEYMSIPGNSTDYSYFYGSDFHNGYALITKKKKISGANPNKEQLIYFGVIDSTGKEIIQPQYESISPVDTFFMVGKNDMYGLVSRSGKTILPPNYGEFRALGNNYFSVERVDFSLYMALFHYDGVSCKRLTPYDYSSITPGGDSAFIVEYWSDKGYIDLNGNIFIKPKYEQAEPFHNGRARVSYQYSGGEFYIDRKGKLIEYDPNRK